MAEKTVCVSGSQGFIGGYLCQELLSKGYTVIGIDNYSKYGKVIRTHDDHPNFRLVEMDLAAHNSARLEDIMVFEDVRYVIAGAAMIGGISYFHKYAYDLFATNERINANTFDACIARHEAGALSRLVVISSSMVYEGADLGMDYLDETTEHWPPWPTKEGAETVLPPPHSTYGFQKLAAEYMAKGAYEQYGLPYTIVRPFNAVGLGEEDSLGDSEVLSGNIKLMLSHVLPDLINKVIKGQNPLHILGDGAQVRCYTHGADIARGIVLAMESGQGLCDDFNISTARSTTVEELAMIVWEKHYGNLDNFALVHDEPYKYDVQQRIPDVSKAAKLLGFEAKISLEESVEEVMAHMKKMQAQS